MKRTYALLLLIALPLFAVDRQQDTIFEEIARDHRAFEAFANATRVIPFDDGSSFIVARDPSNTRDMRGVLVDHAGRTHEFTAETVLPAGSVAAGHVGQFHSAAKLGAGELALSFAYTSTPLGRVSTAVVVVQRRGNAWHTVNVIEFPNGVRDVTAGPNGTLLAITTDLPRLREQHSTPLLTVVDRQGKVLAELFPVIGDGHGNEPPRNAHRARLQRLGPAHFALFDDGSATVRMFDLVPAMEDGRYDAVVRREVSVAALPDGAADAPRVIVKGVHVDASGRVRVARSFVVGESPRTVETVYGGDAAPQHRAVAHEYSAAYWSGDLLSGIVKKHDVVWIERVAQ